MKNLIIIALLAFGGYSWWQDHQANKPLTPQFNTPYVAVYGRNSCGITQKMLSDLRSAGITPRYYIVDDRKTADTLHQRMEASGISTRRYNLPVVETNGHLSVRPTLASVLNQYRSL